MLTQDLSVTLPQLDLTRTAARLRDPGDCEPTRYELYIMASYMREGMRVEKTDTDSTGEFRVFEGGQCVHVECKYKTLDSLRPRRVKEVFDLANEHFREAMADKGCPVLLQISCRTDPAHDDLPGLVDCVARAMSDGISDVGLHIRCSGKFEVELLPSFLDSARAGGYPPRRVRLRIHGSNH
jgi:hypothetical protein